MREFSYDEPLSASPLQRGRVDRAWCAILLNSLQKSLRPAAFNDFRRALAQEFKPHRAAEFARAIGGPGA
jgi:hypothetical protein